MGLGLDLEISTSFWHMADLTPDVSQSRMR